MREMKRFGIYTKRELDLNSEINSTCVIYPIALLVSGSNCIYFVFSNRTEM